jgi:hypothetical protein
VPADCRTTGAHLATGAAPTAASAVAGAGHRAAPDREPDRKRQQIPEDELSHGPFASNARTKVAMAGTAWPSPDRVRPMTVASGQMPGTAIENLRRELGLTKVLRTRPARSHPSARSLQVCWRFHQGVVSKALEWEMTWRTVPTAAELIKIWGAIYQVEHPKEVWLKGILAALAEGWARLRGVGGLLYDISSGTQVGLEAIHGLAMPTGWREVGIAMHRDPRLQRQIVASY